MLFYASVCNEIIKIILRVHKAQILKETLLESIKKHFKLSLYKPKALMNGGVCVTSKCSNV